jgi:hypothetical protein
VLTNEDLPQNWHEPDTKHKIYNLDDNNNQEFEIAEHIKRVSEKFKKRGQNFEVKHRIIDF